MKTTARLSPAETEGGVSPTTPLTQDTRAPVRPDSQVRDARRTWSNVLVVLDPVITGDALTPTVPIRASANPAIRGEIATRSTFLVNRLHVCTMEGARRWII